jgi:hypothetical protein
MAALSEEVYLRTGLSACFGGILIDKKERWDTQQYGAA